MTNKLFSKKGAVTVIFLAVVALVLTLLLAATQSRLLLSLRRSQSASDILVATYQAESEVNDVMARLAGGYLDNANIPRTIKNVGDIRVEIEGVDQGDTQIVTVTALRGLAVGKVQAIRRVQSVGEIDAVEVVLMLDCTGSMDASSGTPGKTRFDAEEDAAVSFVNQVAALPDADKFKLGVGVFGVGSEWLSYNGVNITPDSGLTYFQIADAIAGGFGGRWNDSPACERVGDVAGTNVGLAYRHANNYLKTSKKERIKQVEIVITDGDPNSRSVDSECPPSIACSPRCNTEAKNYLRCTLADKNTFVPELGYNGTRDPEVAAYAAIVLDRPPVDVPPIFQNYATENGYFPATKANQLTGILSEILTRIVEDRSDITIKRIVPTPQ